jgi:hypothetical protein
MSNGIIIKPKEQLSSVIFDIISARSLMRSLEVTSHPIEGGAKITDHTIESNISISLRAEIGNLDTQRPIDAYEELVRIFTERELFEYQTGFEVFSNMLITSLSPIEEIYKPGALVVDITLEQITITQTEEVKLPRAILSSLDNGKLQKQATSENNRGRQEKKEVKSKPVVKEYISFELEAA